MDDFEICPHCGKRLGKTEEYVLGITISFTEDCGCDGAVAAMVRAAQDRAAEAKSKEAEIWRQRARGAGVPMRFVGELDSPMAKQVADDVLNGRGTYIVGPVGTGKTYLACAALQMAMQARPRDRMLFRSTSAFLAEIRAEFGTGERGVAMDSAASAAVLVLDDLGKEKPSAWALETLFTIVDARYGAMRPTIVTTQYKPSDLMARLASEGDGDIAQAIVSRLRGDSKVIRCSGSDMRMARDD